MVYTGLHLPVRLGKAIFLEQVERRIHKQNQAPASKEVGAGAGQVAGEVRHALS